MKKGRLIKEYQRFIEDFDFNETPEVPELNTGEEGQEEIQDDAQGQDEGQEEAEFVNQLMDAIESHEGDPEELREILAAIVHEFHAGEEEQEEGGEGLEGEEDFGGQDNEDLEGEESQEAQEE